MSSRIMDEATRRRLAGLLPFAPGAYVTETLDAFREVEEQYRPRFFLRDLGPRHWTHLRSTVKAERGIEPQDMIEALNDGALVGWENLFDSNLEPIPYSREAVARLPFLWIETLYWKCATLCSPSRIEKEGLDSSPPHASDTSSSPARSAAAALA